MFPSRSRPKKPPPTNPEPRCPVALTIDTSGSMEKPNGDAVNAALRKFVDEIRRDDLASQRVELGVVTFGKEVLVPHPFAPVAEMKEVPPLTFGGLTPLAGAVLKALELIEERKAHYAKLGLDSPWCPVLIVITDGGPSDKDLIPRAKAALHGAVKARRVDCYLVGVDGADFDFLSDFCPAGQKPLKLDGLKIGEFFRWVSQSLVTASQTEPSGERLRLKPEGVTEVE